MAFASLSNGEIDSTIHDGRKVIQMRTTVSNGPQTFLHIQKALPLSDVKEGKGLQKNLYWL
jgi:hypothetical protein